MKLVCPDDRPGRGGNVSLKEELLALTICKDCGTKNVNMVTVPGGWLEFICDECGEVWWYEPVS
jgi:hypothetical protein